MAGHDVFAADTTRWTICRLSNAVKKSFAVPSPRFKPIGFVEELVKIIEKEGIDVLIPNFEESLYLATYRDMLPKRCTLLCESFEKLDNLHNKWSFYEKIKAHGFDTPPSVLVRTEEDLHNLPFKAPYALRECYSRASVSVKMVEQERLPPKVHIEPHNPHMAQPWLHGQQFCTYSIAREGKLTAHATYPVEVGIDGSSCILFRAVQHPSIHQWVERFVELEGFTGQIAFDFIDSNDGKLYAIECNPRSTSGLHLFTCKDGIERALLGDVEKTITPPKGSKRQIFMGMLMYGWRPKSSRKGLGNFLKHFFTSADVVFSWRDLAPFLFQSLLFFRYIWQAMKLDLRLPAAFFYDLEWNNDEAAAVEEF